MKFSWLNDEKQICLNIQGKKISCMIIKKLKMSPENILSEASFCTIVYIYCTTEVCWAGLDGVVWYHAKEQIKWVFGDN